MAVALCTYIGVGLLGAVSTSHAADNMLESLGHSAMPPETRLSAFLFGLIIIGLGVPVNCIVMRYNLLQTLQPASANFIAVLLPWMCSPFTMA